jgi:protocatechuate 3,4-dioxygenase beta subunit
VFATSGWDARAQTQAAPSSAPVAVAGLKPGESVTRAALGDGGTTIHARVIDAHTGRPIEGATVRVDHEHVDRLNSFVQQGVTDAAGTVFLPRRVGGWMADKAVVSAPGYASTGCAASDLDQGHGIRLTRSLPVRGRVLDLEGHPVPRAVITSRNTCAHDSPGVQVVTDVHGLFVLDASDTDEWTVTAPGHGGYEFYKTQSELHDEALAHGAVELFLPRRQPIRVRVLDAQGRPLANTRLEAQGERPVLPAVTDAEGYLVYGPSTEEVGEPVFRLPDAHGGVGVIPDVYPRDATITLSPEGVFEAPSQERATVRIRLEGDVAEDADVQVADSDGVVYYAEGPHDVAAGAVVVTVGHRFSGIAESTVVRTVEVGADVEIVCAAEREAELEIRYPDEPFTLRFVQAGADSLPLWANGGQREAVDGDGERFATVFVPAGERVVALGVDEDGDLRRAVVDEAATGGVLDFSTDASVFRRSTASLLAARPQGRVVVRTVDDRGEPVAAMWQDGDERTVERAFTGPDGAWVFGIAAARGHAMIDWRHRIVAGEDAQIEVVVPRVALVTIVDATGWEQGPLEFFPGRNAFWIDPDSPEESSLLLELDLETGDQRTLKLPE